MKKYYCPYCGERSLTVFQKALQKRTVSVGSNTSNKIWFSCPNCGKEIEKRQTERGKRINDLIIPCYLVLTLFFLSFAVLKMYELMFCAFLIIIILAIIKTLVGYKYDVFIRKSVIHDETVTAKANINLNTKFVEEQIYIIKPNKEYKNKNNIASMYIVALSNFSPECKSCDVRFIKPQNATELICARKFEIYCDHTFVGYGEFVD